MKIFNIISILTLVSVFIFSQDVKAKLVLNTVMPDVSIKGGDGGLIKGTAWKSSMLNGKIHIVFYVDPDEKDVNVAFEKALKAKEYDKSKVATTAIINLKATWLPNFAIESKLKAKQEKYPTTTYVKDKTKVLVKKWQLTDDSYSVLILSKNRELLYHSDKKMSKNDINAALEVIDIEYMK